METLQRVKAAIANGYPQMVFQPIVRLLDMSVAGAEALSRFGGEPVRPPDVWFEDATSVGLGLALELAAAEKALSLATHLPAPLTINVNLSPAAILSGAAVPVLGGGFDPKRIVVEITEHSMVENYAAIATALAPLRKLGMCVAIDDAGAGYSGLQHILDLRPDIIKFDTSLTRDVDKDQFRQAMIAAFTEYGRRTSTKIVAEGVETVAELKVLQELKVEKAQGFLFCRPLPMADFLAQLATWKGPALLSDEAVPP